MISISPVSPILRFDQPQKQPTRYVVSGITRDASLNPLANCTVNIFETSTGIIRGSTISDANGNYSLDVTGTNAADPDYTYKNGESLNFFAVAYSSDGTLVGATVNTLTGTPS